MQHQKILNLFNEAIYFKFVTRKWNIVKNIVNYQSNENYNVGNEIIYDTEVLKSNLCDYNDAYILVRMDIIVTVAPATQVAFKNCAPFTKCITKIDGTTIDDAEDLDLVIPMYNLIEYSSNNSETTGSLWLYSKDEATDFNANNANTDNFKSFMFKTKLLGNTEDDNASGILKNAAIVVSLKYLSNFLRSVKVRSLQSRICI